MSAFCAICIAPITGVPRIEPLGRNDAEVAVCAKCAGDEIVPLGRVSTRMLQQRDSGSDVAGRIRRHRDDLTARGLCVNGEGHGAATRGRLCDPCRERAAKRDAARRAT